MIYCGPTEWRFERRRGSSIDRKNTVRHLIQMMAITEEEGGGSPSPVPPRGGVDSSSSPDSPPSPQESSCETDEGISSDPVIPSEFEALYNDPELRQNLVDLIETANDLDILDFHEFCRNINNPKPVWSKTKATTGKHIPVY